MTGLLVVLTAIPATMVAAEATVTLQISGMT
jgi:hypothetical protein